MKMIFNSIAVKSSTVWNDGCSARVTPCLMKYLLARIQAFVAWLRAPAPIPRFGINLSDGKYTSSQFVGIRGRFTPKSYRLCFNIDLHNWYRKAFDQITLNVTNIIRKSFPKNYSASFILRMRISTISSKSHGRITRRYPRSFFCFIATIGSLFSAFALNAVSRNKVHNDDFWRTLHSMYSSGCSESLFVPCPLLLPDKGTRRVPKKLATRRSNSFHVFLDVGCFTTIPLLRTCSFGGRFRCNTSLRMGMV